MRALLPLLLLLLSAPAFAQKEEDAPIPYDDDQASDGRDTKPVEPGGKKKKSKKQRRDDDFRVVEDEAAAREEKLAQVDDPNIGIGGEAFAGAMLFESSRGALVTPTFAFGFRVTWEFGRLIPDEVLREMFFVDVQYLYAALHDGTKMVFTDTNQHDFSLAPAFAIPLGGTRAPVAFYAQVGAGLNYDFSVLHLEQGDKLATQLSGTKLLLQYGIGLRGRPAIVGDESVRIAWRIEVTRLVRGYMHDTFLGAGIGLVF